jgi:hypothetical protein
MNDEHNQADEKSDASETPEAPPTGGMQWGADAWGSKPWGNKPAPAAPLRMPFVMGAAATLGEAKPGDSDKTADR